MPYGPVQGQSGRLLDYLVLEPPIVILITTTSSGTTVSVGPSLARLGKGWQGRGQGQRNYSTVVAVLLLAL